MKGLLIKDVKLLKNQKQFFLVICIIGTLFLVTSNDPSFVITYMTLMFSIFTLSTIPMMNMIMEQSYLLRCPSAGRATPWRSYVFGLITTMAGMGRTHRGGSGGNLLPADRDRSQTVAGHCRDLSGSSSAAACHNHTDTV